mmetsp:Transcript_23069/g.91490  ORF Transcript_23069/g.91490 Transcript_23069/m.91490 type:complete len:633 (-) Transcript_23069:982-2880(-)
MAAVEALADAERPVTAGVAGRRRDATRGRRRALAFAVGGGSKHYPWQQRRLPRRRSAIVNRSSMPSCVADVRGEGRSFEASIRHRGDADGTITPDRRDPLAEVGLGAAVVADRLVAPEVELRDEVVAEAGRAEPRRAEVVDGVRLAHEARVVLERDVVVPRADHRDDESLEARDGEERREDGPLGEMLPQQDARPAGRDGHDVELLVEARDAAVAHDVGRVEADELVGPRRAAQPADVAEADVVDEFRESQPMRVGARHAEPGDRRHRAVVELEEVRRVEVVLDDVLEADAVVEDRVDRVRRHGTQSVGRPRLDERPRQQRRGRFFRRWQRRRVVAAAPHVDEAVLFDRGVRFGARRAARPRVEPLPVRAEGPAVIEARERAVVGDAAHRERRGAVRARVDEARHAAAGRSEQHERLAPEPRRERRAPVDRGLGVGVAARAPVELPREPHGVPRVLEARREPPAPRAGRRDREVRHPDAVLVGWCGAVFCGAARRPRSSPPSFLVVVVDVEEGGRRSYCRVLTPLSGMGLSYSLDDRVDVVDGAAPAARVAHDLEALGGEQPRRVVAERRREHRLERIRHGDGVVDARAEDVVEHEASARVGVDVEEHRLRDAHRRRAVAEVDARLLEDGAS